MAGARRPGGTMERGPGDAVSLDRMAGQGAVRLPGVVLFVLVAATYAAGYQLATGWFSAAGQGASFFPPAGVTLAALVLVARRQWPIVLAAAAGAELSLDLARHTGALS